MNSNQMARIRVFMPDRVPVFRDGMHAPCDLGNGWYEYEVSQQQAQRWESLSEEQQNELINESNKQKRDLREYL